MGPVKSISGESIELSGAVHIIDDDDSVRRALSRLLKAWSHHEVRDYPTAEAFLAQCRIDVPGCLLVDLKMPSQSG